MENIKMSESKWSIFEDKRYESEVQICRQCKKYTEKSAGGFGFCLFLGDFHSPHQLEWAVVLVNMMCTGFEFREMVK